MLLADMSWKEVAELNDDRIILPLGATEEHGPHLGLGTDTIEAEAIAVEAGRQANVPVAPTLAYGMSRSMLGFAGTLSLRPDTLTRVIADILRSLCGHGFRRVLVVNGHGGNTSSLTDAVNEVTEAYPDLRVKNFQWWTDAEAYQAVTDARGPQQGSHAAGGETAFMLAVRPQAVKMQRLTGQDAPVTPSREILTARTFPARYPQGIMGLNPANATAEAGRLILARAVEICVKEIGDFTP